MLTSVQVYVGREKWRGMAQAGLKAKDHHEFWTAARAAETLDIDTWPEYRTRTKAGEDQWYYLMQSTDHSRIQEVVELAGAQLPLSEIAIGLLRDRKLGLLFSSCRT